MSDIIYRILSELDIDAEAGTVVRKSSKQRPDLVGLAAGYKDNHGYVRLSVAGIKILRSHAIFAFANGRLPTKYIDHINRVRDDDRISNLREADHHENMWNRTPMTRALPMGVAERNGKFVARIMHRRRRIHIGRFATVAEAERAYNATREALYGKFA